MSIVWSCPRETRYQRAASTPIASISSSRKTTSPRRFDIFFICPRSTRWTSWYTSTSIASGECPSISASAAKARDVAVVIGAEHVDEVVEAARELVADVRGVRREVRRRAVRPDEHAVLVVAVRARPRPHRLVLLERVEERDRLGDVRLDLALPRPGVEVDPEALERRLDPLAASPEPDRRRARRARSCTSPSSRPPEAPRRAGLPRRTPGSAPSARPRRCSSTRARRRARRRREAARPSRRTRRSARSRR